MRAAMKLDGDAAWVLLARSLSATEMISFSSQIRDPEIGVTRFWSFDNRRPSRSDLIK